MSHSPAAPGAAARSGSIPMAQGCFSGHGFVASELAAQSCGANLSPGTGVKSSRTCSPVGAIIPKRLVALWEELRSCSLFPQKAESSHSQCPGMFAGACWEHRKAAPSLGIIWEARNRLRSAAPSTRTSLGKCTNDQESQKWGGFVIIGMLNIPKLFHPKLHFP